MTTTRAEGDRFALILFYAVVLAVGYMAFQVVRPFLASMAWAAVFAMVMAPLANRFDRRLSSTWSATLTTVAAALLIVVPAVLVFAVLAREVATLVQEAQQAGYTIPTPERLEEIWAHVRDRSPVPLPADANLSNAIASAAQKVTSFLASKAGAVLQNLFSLVFQLFVMLFGLFFFLRDRHTVVDAIRRLLPFEPARRDLVIEETYNLTVATVGSTFAVAATQGALTGMALWALGFRAPVFWGVMTSIFSILPAVGSALVWLPAAIWLFALGSVGKAILLIIWGAVVVGMADNILRPLLLSGRTSMHGLLVFISVMGGMAAFGFIGLALGPIVIAALRILLSSVGTGAEVARVVAAPDATAPATSLATPPTEPSPAKPPEAEAGSGV